VALDDIYKEVILDHYKSPRNKRELPGAELRCHANNPLCGDDITVYAHVEGDTVAEVTFQGAGCSISQSSASMMTEAVTGKPVAYSTIESITSDLTLGWLVRGMHRWGASVFIILLFLHMGRVFLFGAYKYPRELTWITGVLILATGMLMGFTGYLLPWDQTAYWASAVGINLNGTAPFAGPWLAQFLAGGPEIGTETLPKFYAMHMLLIPGLLIPLIGIHIYLVTRLGVPSPPWSSEAAGRERPPAQPTGARAGLVRGSGGD